MFFTFLFISLPFSLLSGAIAQLGERLPCTQEVGGSIPPGSTKFMYTVVWLLPDLD